MGLKKLVAGLMSHGIVDLFEAIQIQEQHGGLPAVSPRKRDCLANPVAKERSIGQARERIMFGQMGHLLRPRPRRAYVAKNNHRSSDCAFTVVDGGN